MCVIIQNLCRHRSKVSWKELKTAMVFCNSRRCLAVFGWAKPYPSVLLLSIERHPVHATATTSGLSERASCDGSLLLQFCLCLWSCSCQPVAFSMPLQPRRAASCGNAWSSTPFGATCHSFGVFGYSLCDRRGRLQQGRGLLGQPGPAAELSVPAEGLTCVARCSVFAAY